MISYLVRANATASLARLRIPGSISLSHQSGLGLKLGSPVETNCRRVSASLLQRARTAIDAVSRSTCFAATNRFPIDALSDRATQGNKTLPELIRHQFRRQGRKNQQQEENGCEADAGHGIGGKSFAHRRGVEQSLD
jgi:hypothetical protein